MTYLIIETNIHGDIPPNPIERCYLNHSCPSSMSFGPYDMAWRGASQLEAEGMQSRLEGTRYQHSKIVCDLFFNVFA